MSLSLRWILSALLMLLCPATVLAGLRLSPETGLSQPTWGVASGRQQPAAIATDGNDFLVLWTDASERQGLYASRMTSDGKLPARPVAVRRGSYVYDVSAVWTGSSYLAAWTDDASKSVMVAALDRDGSALSAPHSLEGGSRSGGAMAWNGSNALLPVTSSNEKGQPVISALLLTADGAQVIRRIALPSSAVSGAAVGASGGRFALFWYAASDAPPIIPQSTPPPLGPPPALVMSRISASGDFIDPVPVKIDATAGSSAFSVVGGNGEYGLAMVSLPASGPRLRRFRINEATAQLIELSPVQPMPSAGNQPQVVFANGDFLAWTATYDNASFTIRVNRFSQDVFESVAAGASIALEPRAACNSGRCLVAWMSGPHGEISLGGGDVAALLFDSGVQARITPEPVVVDEGSMPQRSPHIAASRGQSLAVWFEGTGDVTGKLVAARLTPAGVPLELPRTIASNLVAYPPIAVAPTDAGYLVVWRDADGSYLVAAAVSFDGAVGLPTRLGADSNGWGISLASNGSTALLAFGTNQGIRALRLDSSGRPLDAAPIVITNIGWPLVVSNGTDFLVAWSEGSDWWQFPSADLVDVKATRVFASGAVDAAPIAVATGPKDQLLKGVSSDGRDFLLVVNVAGVGLTAKRVLREGSLADGTAADDGVVLTRDEPMDASAVPFAGGYLVAWRTWNPGAMLLHIAQTTAAGARPDGGDEIVTSAVIDGWLSLASLGGAAQIAYSRYDETAGIEAVRVFVRLLTTGPSRLRSARR